MFYRRLSPPTRLIHAAWLLAGASLLTACGGGGDDPLATPPGSGGGGSVAAAPLVITAATPASLNGTLGTTTAQYESGSSNEGMTTFAATDSHCRVAGYVLTNSGDNQTYYLEISFRKDTRAVGLVKFGPDPSLALLASALQPATGTLVDIGNRRVGFTNLVLTGGSTSLTLNGALDYPTNVAAENRAACG
jgi:hypothetical protein